jgi:pimeloyl-ACP methyl ester carboxylesterase
MTTLAHQVRGTGEPLVLVHGLGSAASTWDPVVGHLARQFTVITLDLPGHGRSAPLPRTDPATPRRLAGTVARLLDDLDVPTAHLVGNSLGGWVAFELAAAGRARSVTGLAPAGLWLTPAERINPLLGVNRTLAVLARPLADHLVAVRALRAVGFAGVSAYPADLTVDVARDAADAMAAAPGYAAALWGTVGRRFDDAHAIDATVPVTVLFGDRDRVLPARTCQERSLAPAHTHWEVLPHCGHVPQWDAPGSVLRAVRATAARAPRAPETPGPPGGRPTPHPATPATAPATAPATRAGATAS